MSFASSTLRSLSTVSPSRWGAQWFDAFRYHGVLAPGIRLMRRINVMYKGLILGAAFLAPVAVLGVYYLGTAQATLQITVTEREGVRYASAVIDLMDAVQDRRVELLAGLRVHPGADADPMRSVQQSLDELSRVDQAIGQRLGLSEDFRSLAPLHAALLKVGKDSPATAAAASAAYLDGLMRLLDHVNDRSGLSLDPELESYYLAQGVLVAMPDLVEQLHVATTLTAQLQAGSAPARSLLLEAAAALERVRGESKQMQGAFYKVVGQRADETLTKDLKVAAEQVGAFVHAADQVLQGNASSAPEALWAQSIKATQSVQGLRALGTQALDRYLQAREAGTRNRTEQVSVFVVACMVMAFYLLFSVYHVMRGGLVLLRSQVERMARGDLSRPKNPLGADEVATALMALRDSVSRLGDLFAAVKRGVASVSHASAEIAAGNRDLAQRTEQARLGVDEVLRGTQAFSDQLDSCGSLIEETVTRVRTMRAETARSNKAVTALCERMQGLQSKSHQIADVVGLIDGIAFQTNILALNASVEAARVGEAGKGFAVVAEQVRALAQRSAEAADQINTIISSSVSEIESGYRQAERAGIAVEETGKNAEAVSNSMAEVVNLVRGGQVSAREVHASVSKISAFTGGNADLVEQLSAAAAALREQGSQLNDEVASFKLG